MKTEAATRPARLIVNTARQTPAQVPANQTVVGLPIHHKLRHRFRHLDARAGLCRKIQARCSRMLTIAGIGILLYSVSMFLHLIREISLPRTAALPALTTHRDLSRGNGESLL
jgi:hypothetical protein